MPGGFGEAEIRVTLMWGCVYPNADSYKDQTPKQIYRNHENEKKRAYADRVLQVEQGTFTPPGVYIHRRNGRGVQEVSQ